MILESDKFIVSNEAYGEYTKIEFTIDSSKKYYPFVYSYSTYTLYPFRFIFNTCFSRCGTCEDWNYETCLTCKSDPNNLPAPSCECKNGFTHYYNHASNDVC